jgi:hypothetical protein
VSEGPYLYDEGPEPIHTAQPRPRRALLSFILVGTVAVALLMVVLLPLVTGSADKQAKEVTGVFLEALAARDTETAYGLLCDTERQRLTPGQLAAAYLGPGTGTVGDAHEVRTGGSVTEQVTVRWSGGGSSRYTLVNQSGPRLCGTHLLG